MNQKLTPEQFAYWLHGFAELGAGQLPSQEQWDSICEHLDLVFGKVTKPVEAAKPAETVATPEPTKGMGELLQEAIEKSRKEREGVNKQWPFIPQYDIYPGFPQPTNVNPLFPNIDIPGKFTLTC